MPDTKPTEKASQVSAADLAALRDDITKLTASISELVPEQASATTSKVHPFLSVLAAFSARRFNSEVQQRCIDDMAEHRGWGKGRGQGRKSPAAMRA